MSLLGRRIRGFRLVDMVALGVLMLLILGVYLAKTIAGRERAEIASAERQIDAEKARIRLLQAEVTHLEQPARIEHLSETYLGLGPVSIKHEASPDVLGDIALHPAAPSPKVGPAPESAAPAPQLTVAAR
jgi:cell division protein FtsL